MSHISRIASLSVAAVLLLFSCTLPGSGSNGSGAQTDSRSLAEVVADDYIAQIQGTNYSRALVNNKLSASDLTQIRTAILARVKSDGLAGSKDIDKVLPSLMKGIVAGADAFQASTGDNHVAAGLVSAGVKCSATALSKHSDQLSDASVTLTSVVDAVVTVGVNKLTDLAKVDPTSAAAAIQVVVVQVSTELKPLSAKLSAKDVLKLVVTVTVDAAVQGKVADLVQDAFAGAAQVAADAGVVTEVVQTAVSNAKVKDSEVDCVDLLKRAAAGLGDKATDQVLTDAAAGVATDTSTTIDSTAVAAIKAVAAETEPTATLTAAVDGTPVAGDLDYKAGGYTVDLTFGGTASGDSPDFELTTHEGLPDKHTVGKTVQVTLTGSGTFLIQLKVKNHNGVKYKRVFVVIVIKPKADEKAPTASLVIKESTTEVAGVLPWSKDGHTLTLDTTASTGDGDLVRTLTTTADAKVTDLGTGVYQVTQKASTVTYNLFVRNASGIKAASVSKTITIAAEPAPTAKLAITDVDGEPVSGSVAFDGTPQTFTVSSAGSTADAAKVLTVAPAATVVDNGNGTWTVSDVTQDTTFTLKVTNNGGVRVTTATTKLSLSKPVSVLVKEGLVLLEQFKYDEARAKFAAAIAINANDNDAKLWYSYLELAALSVNADVVAVMKDHLGVVDYPANLNTLFSTGWMAAKVYNQKSGMQKAFKSYQRQYVRGLLVAVEEPYTSATFAGYDQSGNWSSDFGSRFVPDAAGDFYAESWYQYSVAEGNETFDSRSYLVSHSSVDGYFQSYNLADSLNPRLFPKIAPVTGFIALDASQAATGYTMTDWMRLAITNVVVKNPSGFNALVDKVAAAGSFQTTLQNAITRLKSIEDGYRTTVPASLLTAWFGSAAPVAVSLGKPEVLLEAAQLQLTTSFLQYIGSVDFSYNLTPAFATLVKTPYTDSTDDGSKAGLVKSMFDSTAGIYHTSLLTERAPAQRAASKASFVAALTSLTSAVSLYQTAMADDHSYYVATLVPFFAPITGAKDAADLRAQAQQALTNASTALAKVTAAVTGGSNLIIPMADLSKGPSAFLGGDLVWPTTAGAEGTTLTVNPAAFWSENFLNPRSWFETDAKGFKPYVTGWVHSMDLVTHDWTTKATTPVALTADDSAITPAAVGLSSLDPASMPTGQMALSFKVNESMYQKLVPGAKLDSKAYLTTSSWSALNSHFDPVSGDWAIDWSLPPTAGARAFLAWVNK